MSRIIALISIHFILVGCAIPIKPVQIHYLGSDHVVEKNFEKGVERRSYVGESVIEMKDYYINKYEKDTLKATVDVNIYRHHHFLLSPLLIKSCSKGEEVKISGLAQFNEQDYYLISPNPGNGDTAIVITAAGEVYNQLFVRGGPSSINGVSSEPSGVVFERNKSLSTDTTKGYVNFEIIYTGIQGNTLRLQYREFTPDDLAKVAFYQDLTYALQSKVIRFRSIKMEIHQATNESITYTVLDY